MTANNQAFQPDWSTSPGETIVDILREKGLSLDDFAHGIGHTLERANHLIQGRATITIAVARKLEQLLGGSVEFWMARDFQYRQDVARLDQTDEEWLSEIPIGDMIKFGWITPVPHPSEELAVCLEFFDVPSVAAWRESYSKIPELVAFKSSPSFDSRPASVAAWLRQGEIQGEAIDCGNWDPVRFQQTLQGIRNLTSRKDPSQFIPDLQKRCAENGVAVVIVRAPNGCRASGAIRIFDKNKALLQLSFRFLTDDHFWFTFFHEAGHLILHGESNFFQAKLQGESGWLVEESDTFTKPEEEEADKFSADTLVPPDRQPELLGLSTNMRDVTRFAVQVGVAPGIIVGQLQHLGRIGYDRLNTLKRRYNWGD